MKKLLILCVALLFFSCEQDRIAMDALGANASIIGTWVEADASALPEVYDGITRLVRSADLDEDLYGFSIHADGSFTERKNGGWCGTPPITYENFEGSWNPLSDSLLDITVAYWGGILTYQIQVVSLEDEKLGIRYLYSEDRIETR